MNTNTSILQQYQAIPMSDGSPGMAILDSLATECVGGGIFPALVALGVIGATGYGMGWCIDQVFIKSLWNN